MAKQRSDAKQQIADLLRTAKDSLGPASPSSAGWTATPSTSRSSSPRCPLLFKEGVTQTQETTLCQAILDGKLPAVIPDLKNFPRR